MGSDKHYPEEAPAHRVTADGFWMDSHTVTNEEFRHFVEATKHLTSPRQVIKGGARFCARRTTLGAIGQRHEWRNQSILPPAIWASAASYGYDHED